MKRRYGLLRTHTLRELLKGQFHEHIDCSLDPRFMLRRWFKIGFDKINPPLPQRVRLDWEMAQALRANGTTDSMEEIEMLESRAARAYQNWLVQFASKSLENYLKAIGEHILPLMQTKEDLYEITRERIQRAVSVESDGSEGNWLELRFAPQLHTAQGLTLDQVMEPVIAAVRESPIPVKLIICSLRHENEAFVSHNPVDELADLVIKYAECGVLDLAGGEGTIPGVLEWWLPAAKRVLAAGKKVTIHLWETNNPTAKDRKLLAELYPALTGAQKRKLVSTMKRVALLCSGMQGIANRKIRLRMFDQIVSLLDEVEDLISKCGRVGHGIRGNSQGVYVLETCPTSNVVTGQVASIEEHPVSNLFRKGRLVTINTDGTLFNQTDLAKEYAKLQRAPHNFGVAEFYVCNRIALAAASFSPEVKARLGSLLTACYRKHV